MIHQYDIEDQFLRDLLQDTPKVKAPKNFTEKVINTIIKTEENKITIWDRWPWILVATAVLSFILWFIFSDLINSIILPSGISFDIHRYGAIIGQIAASLGTFNTYIQHTFQSSFLLAGGIAVTLLLFIERFTSKKQVIQNYMF